MADELLKYTTWEDWVRRAGGENRLKQVSSGDTSETHPHVIEAEDQAITEMETYLRKRGYELPIPVDRMPSNMKAHVLSVGWYFLSLQSEEPLGKVQYEAAVDLWKRIAAGQATLAAESVVSPSTGVIFSDRNSTFDFDDPSSPGSQRMPDL